MAFQFKSLEAELKYGFLLLLSIELIVCAMAFRHWDWEYALLACGLLLTVNSVVFRRIYHCATASIERVNIQLEAVNDKDYSLFAKALYSGGQLGEMHTNLKILTERLQHEKSQFDQQAFVIYRLIEQLNAPILVFNHELQLTSANTAFSDLYGCPWQSLRFSTPNRLNLAAEPQWHFLDKQKHNEWQIRQSHFIDQGKHYHLLVFVNIQSALRVTQLEAWKQLIRVMSHEIKNSLTPVASLAQSLRDKEDNERNQKALDVIAERCSHLQLFVDRYAQLQKPVSCHMQSVHAAAVFESLAVLFPDAVFEVQGLEIEFYADPILLQQILINLIKNACEASVLEKENHVVQLSLQFQIKASVCDILVIDSGAGISNLDNLFVPFYSTKSDGQGIGLALSRHLAEQMGGNLTVRNNLLAVGSTACLSLPLHKV